MAPILSITELLQRYAAGDREIAEDLFRAILPELHRVAARELNRERYSAPVQPTELISEVWLRNLRNPRWTVNSREHFYSIVAIAMRQALVDFARYRLAAMRGSGEITIPIESVHGFHPSANGDLHRIVEIGDLLETLEKRDPIGARIVELQYFAGYTIEEIAVHIGLSARNVRHRWKKAMDWLRGQLAP